MAGTLIRSAAALLLSAATLAPAVVRAQNAQSAGAPRWNAWVGCWQAEGGPAPFQALSNAPTVCVIPTADPSTVRIATVSGGKLVSSDSILATGERRARSRQGCTGWESAQWSHDGERVYLRSQDSCEGGLARTSTGLLALSSTGAWLDVQGVTVSGHTGVRVVRYRSVGTPAGLPPALTAALGGRDAALSVARTAASAPISDAAVIEASHNVDPAVAEAWLLNSGQHLSVDARRLVALADAGVPGQVTDAMVALSYPQQFALNDEPGSASGDAALSLQHVGEPAAADAGVPSGRRIAVFMDPYPFSPFGYDAYGYSLYRYGSSYYGYSPYGMTPYGYSPYSSAYGMPYMMPYGGWYAPPVIVLKGTGSTSTTTPGHVVNGRGYVPDAPATGTRTAQPRSPTYEPPAQSSGTQSPPPPPPDRTAHRRP